MPQTTQLAQFPAARAGMIRGFMDQFSVDAQHVAKEAVAAGLFVTQDATNAQQGKLPTTAAEVAAGLGFAMLETAGPSGSLDGSGSTTSEFQIGASLPLVKQGPGFWAICDEDMAFGDPVFVRFATSTTTNAGSKGCARKDDDHAGGAGGTTATAAQLLGARCERAATHGNPVLISIAGLAAF